MSIATKTGDDGTTALMYGRRVPKHHPRVEAYGCVDELNAALGLARAQAGPGFVRVSLLLIQQDLVAIMGELATLPDDLARYAKDGFARLSADATTRLDRLVAQIEAQQGSFKGWATPGACASSASLDLARTVARRAERRVCALGEANEVSNAEILAYLNRLSDVLWLLARWVENRQELSPDSAGPTA
jgi:cob(I)alamin adenosyltransferase